MVLILHPLAVMQLMAAKAACETAAWSIEALLQTHNIELAQEKAKAEAAKPKEKKGKRGRKAAECSHPAQFREPTPAMGKSGRFLCRQCGKTVEE